MASGKTNAKTKKAVNNRAAEIKKAGYAVFALLFIIALLITVNEKFFNLNGVPTWSELYSAAGLRQEPRVKPDSGENVYVYFIDVGQGDCELIVTPDYTVLIDCGERKYAERVIGFLTSLDIEKLDYIIGTHPHADHMGGMDKVIDAFKPDTVIIPEIAEEFVPATPTVTRTLDAIERNNIKVAYAEAREVINPGNCALTILAPVRGDYDNLNNYSVTVRLAHGGNVFLFCGDIEEEAERDIIDSGADLTADVLKVAHHGSKTSSTKAFLKAVNGVYAVIEVGAPNTYNHPNAEIVERLEKRGYNILRTDLNGNIVFVSDGKELTVYTDS